jgi:NTE family protein
MDRRVSRVQKPTTTKAAAQGQAVKTVNLALQGGGSHGAYTWGVLDALAEDARIEISAISGASSGTMNAIVFASGMSDGGREGARAKLESFWLSVSSEGSLSLPRRWVDKALAVWGGLWPGSRLIKAWTDAVSGFLSPYEFNPFNVNPLRVHLEQVVDFERLRAGSGVKLFIAATNVRTGRGKVFRRNILTADHALASACLLELFQAVIIEGEPYWDGGYAGNPPLWPLFYETRCRDAIIVQINPIEREETPRMPAEIANRVNEITFNASLLSELRAADFVARLVRSGVLKKR